MSDKKGLGKTSIVIMVLVVLTVATITTGVARAADQAPVNLGAAANFGVLAIASEYLNLLGKSLKTSASNRKKRGINEDEKQGVYG